MRVALPLVLLALGCNNHARQCESLAEAILTARASIRGSGQLTPGKPLDGVIFTLVQGKAKLMALDLPEPQLDGDRMRFVRLLDRNEAALRAYAEVMHNGDAADAEDLRARLDALRPDERRLVDEIGQHCR